MKTKTKINPIETQYGKRYTIEVKSPEIHCNVRENGNIKEFRSWSLAKYYSDMINAGLITNLNIITRPSPDTIEEMNRQTSFML